MEWKRAGCRHRHRAGVVWQKGQQGDGDIGQILSDTRLVCMRKGPLDLLELKKVLVGQTAGGLGGCAVPFVCYVHLLRDLYPESNTFAVGAQRIRQFEARLHCGRRGAGSTRTRKTTRLKPVNAGIRNVCTDYVSKLGLYTNNDNAYQAFRR
jgi:hypothetical protein